jgi:dTDP-4-dehydrorhamnose reductase
MKILLFGKDGQVGYELNKSLAYLGELISLGRNSNDYCGDFFNLEGISQTIRDIRPDVILNAAGYTEVDNAEEELGLAFRINAEALALIAKETKLLNALLIHYSTDYVFDGKGDRPWVETDKPAPLNSYGSSKLKGEEFIQNSGCNHVILRTSWVYGVHGNNFIKTIFRLANEGKELSVVNDQIGAPISAKLLAELTALIIPLTVKESKLNGIYHVSPSGETSWLDYAIFILNIGKKLGLEFNLTSSNVKGIVSDQFKSKARRPLNSRLNTSKFQTAFNVELPHWKTDVEMTLKSILEKKSGPS